MENMNENVKKFLMNEIKCQLIHNQRALRLARNNRENPTFWSDVDIATENSDQFLMLVELCLKQKKANKKSAHKAD